MTVQKQAGVWALVLAVFVWGALTVAAHAQSMCAVDLNGNGDASDTGEVASCTLMADMKSTVALAMQTSTIF